MASFLESNFGFEFGAKTCLFWSLWQIISAWLVLEAAGCEQSGLSLLYCGSTSMIPAAKLWNKSLATGCSMMVYPWVDTCRLPGFKTMQRKVPTWHRKTGVWSLLLAWWRMKRVTCFAVWRMELYDSMLDVRLGYASICKRVAGHTHWRSFFGAAAFLVVLDRLCFFWWKPFLASISGRPLLLFH